MRQSDHDDVPSSFMPHENGDRVSQQYGKVWLSMVHYCIGGGRIEVRLYEAGNAVENSSAVV